MKIRYKLNGSNDGDVKVIDNIENVFVNPGSKKVVVTRSTMRASALILDMETLEFISIWDHI